MGVLEETLQPLVGDWIDNYYLPEVVAELERLYVLEALRLCRGNASKACDMIGIHRNSINNKIRQYNIQDKRKSFKIKKVRGW